MPRDSHKRSIAKAAIYRIGSVCVLAALSWITTKDLVQTTIISIGYQVVSATGYYLYERFWEQVKWGR